MIQPFPVPFQSRTRVLAVDNIDTDQIIPARFLTATTRAGLGQFLFADWRGTMAREVVSDRADARVLVAGANFGCGSSREHAVWALADFGFAAVIAPSFSDIFKTNAFKNGFAPIALAPDDHVRLLATLETDPNTVVTIDLPNQTVRAGSVAASFPLEAFAKHCLINGVDELTFLLNQDAAITRFEGNHEISVLADQLP